MADVEGGRGLAMEGLSSRAILIGMFLVRFGYVCESRIDTRARSKSTVWVYDIQNSCNCYPLQ